MWHVWGKVEACTGIWWGDLWEREQLEDLGVDVRMIVNDIKG